MAYGQQLSNGTSDGCLLGQSTSDKLGFYGLTTPIVQPSGSGQAAMTTTVSISTTTEKWGFATSTQANEIITLVNELRAALVALNLIAGA